MNEERTLIIKGEGMARGQDVKIKEIPMNKIKAGRNSRLSVSKEDLSGLMQSINSAGLLEPIGVVESGNGYEIAYGNRRFLAFSKLGLHSIPAIIHKRKKDNDVDVMNLAENVQRRNISLQEVGRYADILEKEGLNRKELAVRMGVPMNYLDACITAFKNIPEKFRNDLEMTTSGKRSSPGKISITAARAIIAVERRFDLSKDQKETLFKSARDDDRFNPDNIDKYAASVKRGSKDPVATVRPIKTLTFKFMLNQNEYEKLMETHVENGPFNSFSALMKAICRGEKNIKLNLLD